MRPWYLARTFHFFPTDTDRSVRSSPSSHFPDEGALYRDFRIAGLPARRERDFMPFFARLCAPAGEPISCQTWISLSQTPWSLRTNRPWHAEPEHVATPSWTPPVAAEASACSEARAKKKRSVAKPAMNETRDLVHRPTEPHPRVACSLWTTVPPLLFTKGRPNAEARPPNCLRAKTGLSRVAIR